ncbi:MAG: LuxR C-terminal-related transcriptional regulator [Oscillospiraceae bacterium]|jgi:DNA-binding CsgD family transcriptional regulator|nr:LuxR C-terminal-related transcriptional regulator [Oscillospiraceae bacterium]
MSELSILSENESKRLNLRLPWLLCFAMFAAWQIGMVYFSGQTLSVDGRTPLPVNIDDITLIIAAGYILSILVMLFIPRLVVWLERITASVALVSALALFLPLSAETLVITLYVQYFCCCLMTGFETSIIVGLFTEKTAVLHLAVAYGVANGLVAILHNDFVQIPFTAFRLFTVIALTLMVMFFFKLPRNVWTRSVKKSDGLIAPKKLFAGIFLWTATSCFAILFGTAVAEGFAHGVSVFYLSGGVAGIILYLLWKHFGIVPFNVFSVYIAIGAMGFVLAVASLHVPALSLAACVLLGVGSMACWINPLLGVLMAKQYPSKFIAPGIIGVAFITVLIHAALLDVFRNSAPALCMVYLVIAVACVIIYLILEPYLLYAFHGKPLISHERAAELIEAAKEAAKIGEVLAEDVPVADSVVILLDEVRGHPDDDLTERERQIAQELMLGLNYKQIAAKLHISPYTVSSHKKSIYSKKGVHNVPELILKMGRVQEVR